MFKPVNPNNDPSLQLKEIREAHRKKWEQERHAEGSDLQQESLVGDGSGAMARPFEEPQGESIRDDLKRKAHDVDSDDVEFVSQAKKPKARVEEAPRSLFGTVPALVVRWDSS